MRILELAEKVMALAGSKSKAKFYPFPRGDHRRRLPSIEKAKRALAWEAKTGLSEGLEWTFRWLKANPSAWS